MTDVLVGGVRVPNNAHRMDADACGGEDRSTGSDGTLRPIHAHAASSELAGST
jgi:hypothetical protein